VCRTWRDVLWQDRDWPETLVQASVHGSAEQVLLHFVSRSGDSKSAATAALVAQALRCARADFLQRRRTAASTA
jgi:hypothetical protein